MHEEQSVNVEGGKRRQRSSTGEEGRAVNPSPSQEAAETRDPLAKQKAEAETQVCEVLDHLQRAQGLIERASRALAAVDGMAGESRGLGKVYKDVRRAWYVVNDRAEALRKRGELYANGASPRDPDLS